MSSTSARNLDLEAAAFADLRDLDNWRVYADWLQSVGDPRGDLIGLELLRHDAFRSERAKLDEQIRSHGQPYRDAWQQWAQSKDLLDITPTFRGGFVVEVKGQFSQLVASLDELFEREPVQRLALYEVDDEHFTELCERRPPWLSRLVSLRLAGGLGPAGTAALAANPLPRLCRLNLLGNAIEAQACRSLASLEVTALGSLTLTANDIDDEALAALLEATHRGQWRSLHLSSNDIGPEGVAKLAHTSGLEALEQLSLRAIAVKFADLAVLLEANWPAMRRLEVPTSGYWKARELNEQLKARFGPALVLC